MRGTMAGVDDHFIDWMMERYRAWVNAANTGLMTCGGLVFKKRAVSLFTGDLFISVTSAGFVVYW